MLPSRIFGGAPLFARPHQEQTCSPGFTDACEYLQSSFMCIRANSLEHLQHRWKLSLELPAPQQNMLESELSSVFSSQNPKMLFLWPFRCFTAFVSFGCPAVLPACSAGKDNTLVTEHVYNVTPPNRIKAECWSISSFLGLSMQHHVVPQRENNLRKRR